MKEGCNPEVEIIDASDIRRMTISIQHLLNVHGKPSAEYGVGQAVKFFNTAVDSYRLTPDEPEFDEMTQEITVKSVVRDTGNYKKGLYVDVWTNLTPPKLEDGPLSYWRLTEYGLLLDNTFYVNDEFQIVDNESRNKPQPCDYTPAALALEMCGVSPKAQRKEIFNIESSLGPDFTITDYMELTRLLTECNPANVFYD